MSALQFSLRETPPQRLDLSALIPERLADLEMAEILRLSVTTTRQPLCVGDVFTVHPGRADEVVIEGGSARFDEVGAGMTRGTLTVEGEVGARAGRGMQGGRLLVRGDAGVFAASGMRGGEIEIGGSVGAFLAAPRPGERLGMAGGLVVVRGNAGPRAGDRLRRGVIVIEGDTGDEPASRMLAGTLIVCGRAGARAGYLMRRGTLVAAQAAPLPTFVPIGSADQVFRTLLARAVAAVSPAAAELLGKNLTRFGGDVATLGKGEMFIRIGQIAATG